MTEMTDTSPDTGATNRAFTIGQIYLIRASFSHRGQQLMRPAGTSVSPQRIHVGIGLDNLNNGAASQIRVSVKSDSSDENALYDFDIEYAAIVEQVDRENWPDRVLAEHVAAQLFPFAREVIANITGRGRFGPVWVNPFNLREALAKSRPVAEVENVSE